MRPPKERRKRGFRFAHEPAWLRMLMDLPFVGVVVLEARTLQWVRVNQNLCALLGHTQSQILRLGARGICHPADRTYCERTLRQMAVSHGERKRLRTRIMRSDGVPVAVEIDLSKAISREAAGDFLVALVHPQPAAADAEEAHYRRLFRQDDLPVVLLNAQSWQVVDANPAAQAFYGWSIDAFRQQGLSAWDVSTSDQDKVLARLKEAAAGAVVALESVHRIASGALREVEVTCTPVDIAGRRFVYGVIHDVSGRRGAHRMAGGTEDMLRAVVEQSIFGIYVIDEGRLSYANARMAEIFGYLPGELVGKAAVDVVAPQDRGIALENIRRRAQGEVGTVRYECLGLRKDGSIIHIGVQGSVARVGDRNVIIGTLQDITDKVRAQTAALQHMRALEQAIQSTIDVISTIGELRDPYTQGHERRVGELAAEIGREMGLDPARVEGLRVAGYMHDVGKIAIPAELLSKPTRLSGAEFALVKGHAGRSHDILKGIEFAWPVATVALQHHERLDGSGYPQGLKGDAIVPEAQILAAADVTEAMASHRPYRPALGIDRALEEIRRGRGTAYEPGAAEACERIFARGYMLTA